MLPGRVTGKRLTDELRKLAAEAVTITDDGTPVTREQQLSAMIWKQALGWTEQVRDQDGDLQERVHPPVAWCQQFLFERMEGRAPNAMPDAEGGVRATDKVRELAKQRLNGLVKVSSVKTSAPPIHRPKLNE